MDHDRQQKIVDHFKKHYGADHEEAKRLMGIFEMGFDTGQDQGRADAQRFFRLALGVETPTPSEAARWMNPVPLKDRG